MVHCRVLYIWLLGSSYVGEYCTVLRQVICTFLSANFGERNKNIEGTLTAATVERPLTGAVGHTMVTLTVDRPLTGAVGHTMVTLTLGSAEAVIIMVTPTLGSADAVMMIVETTVDRD